MAQGGEPKEKCENSLEDSLEDKDDAQDDTAQGQGLAQAIAFAEKQLPERETEHHVGPAQGRDHADQGARHGKGMEIDGIG